MKSSFRLIGAYWDGRPKEVNACVLDDFDPSYLAAAHSDCLFDFIEKKRRLQLSRLISVDSDSDFNSVCAAVSGSLHLAIEIDCRPAFCEGAQGRFFHKRMLQILRAVEDAFPKAKVVLMPSKSDVMA